MEKASPASRSALVSPTQMIATSPARIAALALARTILSVSLVAGAALRMAKDHIARPGILDHFGGNIAGEGAACLGMAILAANPYLGAFANRRNGHEQGRGGTNDNFRFSRAACGHGLANRGRFDEAFAQAVHLPIARDEGALIRGSCGKFPVISRKAALHAGLHLFIVPRQFVKARRLPETP